MPVKTGPRPLSAQPPAPSSVQLYECGPLGRPPGGAVMKKMIAALVVATAAAGAGVTIANADQGDDTGLGGHRHHRRFDRAAMLEKYDANHNGVLDPEE